MSPTKPRTTPLGTAKKRRSPSDEPPARPAEKAPPLLPLPDLLYTRPHLALDRDALEEILGMAALGRSFGTEFHDQLGAAELPRGLWRPEFFAEDLFLDEMVRDCLTLEIGGRPYPTNHRFLAKAISHVPTDHGTILMRQGIVRELDDDEEMLGTVEKLYVALFDLVSLHRTPSYQSNLDVAAFHLDILRQARFVIDLMEAGFVSSKSSLRRLHEAAVAIQKTEEYRTLAALLEYENGLARLELEVRVGGDGRIRDFVVRELQENTKNAFYRNPLRRFFDRTKLMFNGYPMNNRELMKRLINDIYRRLSHHFVPMLQLIGHLEFYLTARAFRELAGSRGLEMNLAEISDETVSLTGLFNPLLLKTGRPVPTRLELTHGHPITIITGPNSGGKTRLLQSIAITQLLGQSGLYAPCAHARIRVLDGLFVSLVEDEAADQTEGRLGRELVRIRSLFEEMALDSMVILDELCSGTNPSEGIEVFEMVLQLLSSIRPTAFVTTHFLDFARSLTEGRLDAELEFRQVEIDARQRSTYQFLEGVADTSLASVTAARLGVTFDRLSEIIRARGNG